MTTGEVAEAARVIERLTGIPPGGHRLCIRRRDQASPRERRAEKARLARFMELSPELQEGCLRYAEQMLRSYRSEVKASQAVQAPRIGRTSTPHAPGGASPDEHGGVQLDKGLNMC